MFRRIPGKSNKLPAIRFTINGRTLHFKKNTAVGLFIKAYGRIPEKDIGKQDMEILRRDIWSIFRTPMQILQPLKYGLRNLGVIAERPALHLQRAFPKGMQQQIQQTGQIEFVMYTGRVNASHYI